MPFWSATSISSLLLSLHLALSSFLLVTMGFSLTMLLLISKLWVKSFLKEQQTGFEHLFMKDSLNLAMIFFIMSEALLFITFFWSWFNHKWSPLGETTSSFKPMGVVEISFYSIPLLNTLLLLSSAISLTVSHHSFISKEKTLMLSVYLNLWMTVLLASLFLTLQIFEYVSSTFTISDSIYGATFFLLTGFHGFHVFLAVCLLLVSTFLIFLGKMNNTYHLFFELTVYYYHFVDVVWLGLFFVLYM